MPSGSTQCTPTAPGTYARRTYSVIGSGLPAASSSNCVGVCSTAWRLTADGLESGIQMGEASSYFVLPVDVVSTDAYAGLTLSFSGSPASALHLLIDSSLVSTVKPSTLKRAQQTVSIPLPLGPHNLTLNFVGPAAGVGAARSYVSVSVLDVFGSSAGFASAVPCPAGSVSSTSGSSSCAPCQPGTFSDSPGSSTCTACPVGSFASDTGASACVTCGSGSTTPSAGSAKCTTTCNFASESGVSFDLRQLGERTLYDLRNSREIVVNPCGFVSRLGCESYACTRSPDAPDAVVVGRNPEFSSPVGNSSTWMLTYKDGRVCESGTRSLAAIRFKCDTSGSSSLGEPRVVESDSCSIYMEWVTPAACPSCQSADFIQVYGKCQAGVQRITYVAKSGCYNSGFSQPNSEEKSCSAYCCPLFLVAVA